MFETFLTRFNALLDTYWQSTAGSVIGAIAPVAMTLATIYVVLWGYSVIFGMVQEPVMDGVRRILKLAAVLGVVLSVGYYATFLGNLFWGLPDGLISAMAGGSSTSTGAGMDALFQRFFALYQALNEKAHAESTLGIPAPSTLIQAYAVLIAGGLLAGDAAVVYVIAKMGLAVLLGIGPIAVLLLMFEPTRRFFESWVGGVVTFGFVAVFGSAAVGVTFVMVNGYMGSSVVQSTLGDPSFAESIAGVIFALISLVVLWQVPTMAQAFGGSIALNTMGAVKGTFDKGKSAAGGAYNVARGNTLADHRFARSRRVQMAEFAQKNPGLAMRTVRAPGSIYAKVTGRQANAISAAPPEAKTGT